MLKGCAGLSGGRSRSVASVYENEVNIQKTADLAVEIDATPFDAGPKKGALAHVQNLAFQTKTVRMYQTSNPDTVTNLDFSHGSP